MFVYLFNLSRALNLQSTQLLKSARLKMCVYIINLARALNLRSTQLLERARALEKQKNKISFLTKLKFSRLIKWRWMNRHRMVIRSSS